MMIIKIKIIGIDVSVSRLSWFLQASVFFLLTFSCTTFRPVYQSKGNDPNAKPEINIREGSRIKLVLHDDLSKVNIPGGLKLNKGGLKFEKYMDKNGIPFQKLEGEYYFSKVDSTYMNLYAVGRTNYGESFSVHFEIPIDQIAFVKKRKFSFGKTIGIVGIAFVGFSIFAISTASW